MWVKRKLEVERATHIFSSNQFTVKLISRKSDKIVGKYYKTQPHSKVCEINYLVQHFLSKPLIWLKNVEAKRQIDSNVFNTLLHLVGNIKSSINFSPFYISVQKIIKQFLENVTIQMATDTITW